MCIITGTKIGLGQICEDVNPLIKPGFTYLFIIFPLEQKAHMTRGK